MLRNRIAMREVEEAVQAYLSWVDFDPSAKNVRDILDLVEKSVPSVEAKFWKLVDKAQGR